MRLTQWLDQLRVNFASPVFPDDAEKTYRARLLNSLINIALLIIPLLFIGNLNTPSSPPLTRILIAAAFFITLGLRQWMLRGWIRAASILWIALAAGMVILSATALGTVRATNTAIFLIIIASAGLLLSPWIMGIVITIASAAIAVLIYAQNAGWLPPADDSVTYVQWINYTVLFIGMGSLIYRSWQIIQDTLRREQYIHEISYTLSNSNLDLSELFQNILQLNSRLLGADAAAISLISADGTTLDFLQGYNLPKGFSKFPMPKNQGVAWDIIEKKASIRLDNYAAHPKALPEWIEDGVVSFMGIPIIADGKAIGIIGLFSKDPGRRFDRRDQQIAENIGQQSGLAIEKARLFQATREALDREQRINELSNTINNTLDLDILMEKLTRQTAAIVRADVGSLALIEESGFKTSHVFALNLGDDPKKTEYSRKDGGIIWDVFDTKQPIIVNDYGAHSKARPAIKQTGTERFIAVPLMKGDKCLGVLGLMRRHHAGLFDQRDLELLSSIGRQAATAIQNAQLYTELNESQHQLKQALEAGNMGSWNWDIAANTIRWSDNVEAIFGLKPGTFGGTYESYLKLIPDNDRPAIQESIRAALENHRYEYRVEHRVIHPGGDVHWLEGRGQVLRDAEGHPISMNGMVLDITERKRVETALRERDVLLQSVALIGEQFLQSTNWRATVSFMLEKLGSALQASHAYIFEHHTLPDGAAVGSQRHEWCAPGVASELHNPQYQNMPLAPELLDEHTESWYAHLSQGLPYAGNLNSLSQEDSEYFAEIGIKAIIEIPIMSTGKWWGTIGFDDRENTRTWSDAEVESIKVATDMLGAAIERAQAEAILQHREHILETIAFAGQSFLETAHWSDRIQSVLENIGQSTDASHVYIFKNHEMSDGEKVTSQIYEWTAPGEQSDLLNPLYQNVPLEEPPVLRWYDELKKGQPFYGSVKTLKPEEAEHFLLKGVRSILDVPIFVEGKWWGIIGVDHYHEEREWSATEIDALKVAASVLGSAIARALTDEQLHQRDAILEAMAFAGQQFLLAEEWTTNLLKALEHLGLATRCSHVYIFENHLLLNGEEGTSLRYEWTAPGQTSDLGNSAYQNAPHVNAQRFTQDGYYIGKPLREGHNEVKVILEIPIYVNGQWWGLIGFDDCKIDRNWSTSEIDTLKVAAGLIGTSIQRQRSDAGLRQRDRILESVAIAAQGFLQTQSWKDTIGGVLQRLGETTGVSHAYIFERHALPDGSRGISQRFEWTAPGIKPDMPNADYQNVNIDVRGFKRWREMLESGSSYIGNKQTFQPGDDSFLLPDGCLTILEMPIFVNGQWWGMIGFDDHVNERMWSFAELETLKAAASLIGEAIQREWADHSLRQREAILEAVTFAGQQFLQTTNWRLNINSVLQKLGEATDASHVYVFENLRLPDGSEVTSQTYEWAAPGQVSELGNDKYQNMLLDPNELWYQMHIRGEPIIRDAANTKMPDPSLEQRISPGLLTKVEVPIMVSHQWWGEIGFDDYVNFREWSNTEIEALRLAADMIGTAIERQQTEEILRNTEMNYRFELEQRVRERTAQLETAVKELESFSYSTSHDLRAPLRAVDGYSRILIEDYADKLDETGRQYMQYIRSSAQRMGHLIDDLLNYSRMGRTALSIRPLVLDDTFKTILFDLETRIAETGAEIWIDENIPPVLADATLISQIFTNLINNALTYHRDGVPPKISISAKSDSDHAIICVADNGIGIPREYTDKIFHVFQRLHRDDEYQGTGIGLSIVKRAVEMLNGEIWVDSEPGKGSSFFVKLPIAK